MIIAGVAAWGKPASYPKTSEQEISKTQVELVKVRGRGIGTNKMEALKDAYRDAVEQAVGLYVDAEQMVKNEDLVKDQILTQSNAYIEKYTIAKESTAENGLITITILADVRKRDLHKKIRDVMPKQNTSIANVSQNLHAQIVTDFKANDDAVSLIKNELDGLSPLKQLMKVTLHTSKPVVESISEKPDFVRLWYPIRVEVDARRYYKDFAPRWSRILDQIKTAPEAKLNLRKNMLYLEAYNETITKEYGTTKKKKRKGIMTVCDRANNINTKEYGGDGVHFYYESNQLWNMGLALNEEYQDVGFWDLRIFGNNYVLHGCKSVYNGLGAFNRRDLYDHGKPENKLINRFFSANRNSWDMVDKIASDCDFVVGIVTDVNGAEVSGKFYEIPQDCIDEICNWQNRMAFGNIDQRREGCELNVSHCWSAVPEVRYILRFLDYNANEVVSRHFPLYNLELMNFGCVLFEEPERRDREYVGGKRLWLITPLVGGFAKSYVKWISVDIPKDDVAKIATASISVEE
jgi:hypothetical protein